MTAIEEPGNLQLGEQETYLTAVQVGHIEEPCEHLKVGPPLDPTLETEVKDDRLLSTLVTQAASKILLRFIPPGREAVDFSLRREFIAGSVIQLCTDSTDLRLTITIDVEAGTIGAKFHFPAPHTSAHATLRSLELRRLFAEGGTFTLTGQDPDISLCSFYADPPSGLDSVERLDAMIRSYAVLSKLEEVFAIVFDPPPKECSEEQVRDLIMIESVLEKGLQDLGSVEMTFPCGKNLANSLLQATNSNAQNISFSPSSKAWVEIFGRPICLGENVVVIEQPIVSSEEHRQEIEAALQSVDQDVTIRVKIRSAVGKISRIFLDWTQPRTLEINDRGSRALQETILTALEENPKGPQEWIVGGPPGSGKSRFLRGLSYRLMSKGWLPMLISPPRQSEDAGVFALAQVFEAAKSQGLEERGWPEVCRLSWSEQLALLTSWLGKHPRSILLLDEPSEWAPNSPEDSYFRRQIDSLALRLLNSPSHRVVTRQDASPLRLQFAADPSDWLRDRRNWGSLADAARALADLTAADGKSLNPLEIQLVVGILAIAQELPHFPASRRELSQVFSKALESSHPSVSKFWGKASKIRHSVTRATLDSLGLSALTAKEQDLVVHCLFSRRGQWLEIHDLLRNDAPPSREARFVHAQLAAELKALASPVLQVEGFHHSLYAGDDQCLPEHSDQMLLRGRQLLRSQSFELAKQAFQSVLKDSDNDYAHHHLAVCLQNLGAKSSEIRQHYRRAVELQPHEPRWWIHEILFLLLRGRPLQAQKTWGDALDALGNWDYEWGCSHLIVPLAAAALIYSQLEFAKEILSAIPARLDEDPKVVSLRRRYAALKEAELRGGLVPLCNLTPDWWSKGPFLPVKAPREELQLYRWLPGRLDSRCEGKLHFRVASVSQPPPTDPPPSALLTIEADQFNQWSDHKAELLQDGDFVEFHEFRLSDGLSEACMRVVVYNLMALPEVDTFGWKIDDKGQLSWRP
jgi:hypothetical protein